MKLSYSLSLFLFCLVCFQRRTSRKESRKSKLEEKYEKRGQRARESILQEGGWRHVGGCPMVTQRFWSSWRGTMIPRALGSLPTQTLRPTKQSPTIPCSKQGRERRGGGEGLMRVWTGWRRDTPAPWRSLRQLIFSLTMIAPVKITAKIHSQPGTG